MPDQPFFDPEINKQIRAKTLRINAASLTWSEKPTDPDLVQTLVEAFNAHAQGYLCKVVREDLIPQYVSYMRGVGSALIRKTEQHSFLQDRYSDERLREIAESSGPFIVRKHSMTPEQQDDEIRKAVEGLRFELMKDAQNWHTWREQLLFRIETQFESRYRCWEADAIKHVQSAAVLFVDQKQAGDATPEAGEASAAQPESEPAGDAVSKAEDSARAQSPTVTSSEVAEGAVTSDRGENAEGGTDARLESKGGNKENAAAASWDAIEISFLSDFRVQITLPNRTYAQNFGELGFADQRPKRGEPKPNLAWEMLRRLAEKGIISSAKSAGTDWTKVEKRMQEIRKALRSHFGIAADPLPFVEGTGYRALFKIGCSPSYRT